MVSYRDNHVEEKGEWQTRALLLLKVLSYLQSKTYLIPNLVRVSAQETAVSRNWGWGPFCGCPNNRSPTIGVYIRAS